MTAAMLGLAAAFGASLVVERAAARPSAPGPSLLAIPVRFFVFALIALVWLGIFGRPWLASCAALGTVTILTAISVKKRRLVGEPLVFSDFGLARLVVKHPDLYYTDAFTTPPMLLAMVGFAAAIGLWLWLEPALIPAGGRLALGLGVPASIAFLWAAARGSLAAPLRASAPKPALDLHVARWGLLLTLVIYALRWRGETTLPYPAQDASVLVDPDPLAPDLVVVVQIESFMDAARMGQPTSPGLAAARAKALVSGGLRVPSHGAYTMRSEFAVLTGLSEADLGFRRFDPYLSTIVRGAPPVPTLATRLVARGFRTIFMHPFRAGFFDREAVMRRLGFEILLWEGDFAEGDRAGPYTSDPAVIRRILAEAGRIPGPAFIMAVTMENHGPWQPGRVPGESDPARQYLAHLASSDRAIALLLDGLSDYEGRALVCLFGDHPPILPCLDPARPPETDYVVLDLGTRARAHAARELPLDAAELGRVLMSLCAAPGPEAKA